MRKACIIISSLFILYSCNSSEEKPKPIIIQKEKPVPTAADLELENWLKGKIWTAENDVAPMFLLKLKSDGGYELRTGNPGTWQVVNGKIGLDRLTEWPIEKLTDSAFRLYVKPTDKWYTYKHTSNLD